MKKKFSMVVAVLFALVFVVSGVALAARGAYWQCQNCGEQIYTTSESGPDAYYGCGGDFNKRHIYRRM